LFSEPASLDDLPQGGAEMEGARTAVLAPETAEPSQPAAEPPLQALLEDLYRKQLALDPEQVRLIEHSRRPNTGYLAEHSRPACIANGIRTFHWYRRYLPVQGSVLDWGCQHAPDSCLIRAWFGDRFRLHGCDFLAPGTYSVFHEFAQLDYTQLGDEVRLPFASDFFDVVLGSGVLEHAPTDYESLKELRRVLRPDGFLILTYLPNWLSLKEWWRRVVPRRDFHLRLYGLRETKRLLKHCGFNPIAAGYQTFFWQRLAGALGLGRWQDGLARMLARLLPVHLFSSTLCLVAQKMWMM
jgi:SAM-dependent methyltransferase